MHGGLGGSNDERLIHGLITKTPKVGQRQAGAVLLSGIAIVRAAYLIGGLEHQPNSLCAQHFNGSRRTFS
jgi:hypothetical protein